MPTNETTPPGQLPTTPEEITATWLAEVLGFKIKMAELTKAILDATASKLSVAVTYDDDDDNSGETSRPRFLCIKGGFNPSVINAYPHVLGMYQREADFFNQVAPTLSHIDFPKAWWASSKGNQGLVIMDDLSAHGAEFGSGALEWPVERVLAGVEQLAGLHAGTWGHTNADYPWLKDPDLYDQIMFDLCDMWDALVLAPNRPPVPDGLKDQKRTKAALRKHFLSRNPKFRCLVHGDAHTGNTYLLQGAPKFLDWQTIHVASAFHDVSYFITGTLSIEDRRSHEMRILDHYLDSLARFGAPRFSSKDEDVLIEYRKSMLSGYGWITAPYEVQSEPKVRAMVPRYCAALTDHQTFELIESLPAVE